MVSLQRLSATLSVAQLLQAHPAQAQEQGTTTVIDVLSQNVEFSVFLRMLQHNQLVPYLNQQADITLVAPVNSAFAAAFCSGMGSGNATQDALLTSALATQSTDTVDSLACLTQIFNNFSLQQLNHYIITEPLNTSLITGYHIYSTIANTDADNSAEDDDNNRVQSPVLVYHDARSDETTFNGVYTVENNLFAPSQNSYVQGVESVIHELKNLDETISNVNETSIIEKMKGAHLDAMNDKTLLVPIDDSFVDFEDYQLEYFFTKFAEQDSQLIVNSIVVDGIHGGAIHNVSVKDQNGLTRILSSKNNGHDITLNGLTATRSNILARGGVIHLFNSTDLIPEVEFNVLKTLVGLKATSFVDELLLQDLSHLLTNNSIEQTIFYPMESNQFSIQSKSANLYHFVDERITNFTETRTLYSTLLCNTKKMGDTCQKLKVENFGEYTVIINNNVMVESGPYEVGNTLIYLTDEDLRTPGDLLSSVNSAVFHCTDSLKHLSTLNLLKLSNNYKGYSLLLPCYDSWDDYSLTMNYLKSNTTALEILMKNFILEGLLYTDFVEDEKLFTNLNGKNVIISFEGEEDKHMDLKYDEIEFELGVDNDILFSQGVLHPIQEVFFPSELDISILNILEHTEAELFLSLLAQFDEFEGLLTSKKEYSLLLPTPASLARFTLPANNNTLKDLLRLHIIPEQSLEDLYECSETSIRTLHPKFNITCSNSGEMFLQADGSEDSSRIVRKGCTPGLEHACVYLIDKPILTDHNHYHISLPATALSVGVILGVLIMTAIVVCLMLCFSGRRSRLAEGDENGNEDGENGDQEINEDTSLMQGNMNHNGYDSTTINFESQYSENTSVNPIAFGKRKVQQQLV